MGVPSGGGANLTLGGTRQLGMTLDASKVGCRQSCLSIGLSQEKLAAAKERCSGAEPGRRARLPCMCPPPFRPLPSLCPPSRTPTLHALQRLLQLSMAGVPLNRQYTFSAHTSNSAFESAASSPFTFTTPPP